MPPHILSSHLVTIPVLDTLLASTSSPPTPSKRVQLLSTKLAILTNRPSQPARGQPFEVEIQILRCRLDLAAAHLAQAADPRGSVARAIGGGGGGGGELILAESELALVEKECKGIIKRYSRLVKLERDKVELRAKQSADAEAEAEDEGQSPVVSPDPSSNPGASSVGMTPSSSNSSISPSADVANAEGGGLGADNGGEGGREGDDLTSRLTELGISDLPAPTTTPPKSTRTDLMTPSSSTSTPESLSTPSLSTPLTPFDSSGSLSKRQTRLKLVLDVRVEGLKMAIEVEDKLGRVDKRARLEGLVRKLEAG